MNQLVHSLEALDPDLRRMAYERFWLSFTVAARALWRDPELSEAEKLAGLKWLNEIQA